MTSVVREKNEGRMIKKRKKKDGMDFRFEFFRMPCDLFFLKYKIRKKVGFRIEED